MSMWKVYTVSDGHVKCVGWVYLFILCKVYVSKWKVYTVSDVMSIMLDGHVYCVGCHVYYVGWSCL